MSDIEERRLCTRTVFFTTARICFPANITILEVELTDISIVGMYVNTKAVVPVGSPCTVQIEIRGCASRLVLEDIQGVVVRSDTKGLGIQFTANMEWFVLFKVYNHYSEHNSQDHDVVITDTSDFKERRAGMVDRRGVVIDRRKV